MKDKIIKFFNSKWFKLFLMHFFAWLVVMIGGVYYYNHGITFKSVAGFIMYSWLSCIWTISDVFMEIHKDE